MVVKVLSTNCTKCKKLEQKIFELKEIHNLDFEYQKIPDIDEMLKYGIMMTPGLVIDEEVKSFGIVPKEKQLLEWLKQNK